MQQTLTLIPPHTNQLAILSPSIIKRMPISFNPPNSNCEIFQLLLKQKIMVSTLRKPPPSIARITEAHTDLTNENATVRCIKPSKTTPKLQMKVYPRE